MQRESTSASFISREVLCAVVQAMAASTGLDGAGPGPRLERGSHRRCPRGRNGFSYIALFLHMPLGSSSVVLQPAEGLRTFYPPTSKVRAESLQNEQRRDGECF